MDSRVKFKLTGWLILAALLTVLLANSGCITQKPTKLYKGWTRHHGVVDIKKLPNGRYNVYIYKRWLLLPQGSAGKMIADYERGKKLGTVK